MVLRTELASILAFLLHLLKLLGNHCRKQFLGLDERHLNVSVGIAVESQLTGYANGQTIEDGEVLGGKVTLGEVHLLVAADLLGLGQCQHIVQLGDELLDGRNELDDTFRNDNGAEVIAVGSTGGNGIGDVVDDVVETHGLLLNLL